jgi:hypothetical protein
MLNLTRTGKDAGEGGSGLLETIDEKNDALIVINGTGVIMMINQVGAALRLAAVAAAAAVCRWCAPPAHQAVGCQRCGRARVPSRGSGSWSAALGPKPVLTRTAHGCRKQHPRTATIALCNTACHPSPALLTPHIRPLQPALRIFGYQKGEVEGKNVTVLMPPPFSTRHHAYLQAYHATGKGAILNCMRELVALHKVRARPPGRRSSGGAARVWRQAVGHRS